MCRNKRCYECRHMGAAALEYQGWYCKLTGERVSADNVCKDFEKD